MAKMGARKLYRRTDQRMIGGVCAGLAHYFDLPVNLVRALAVVALFLGFFAITIVIYLLMWFFIEPAPAGYQDETDVSVKVTKLMNEIDQQLKAGEKKLRQMERYITSDSFSIDSRINKL
ncbi:envelope stress response membrane protein PspC [Arsenophonus sp. ENCA]|uniref:envelope stress response membrane protein PspC n=1 Tax=unclassified Arsenophonus TaxID=2627083 RepID=UPI000BC765B3|nr:MULTISPECIES: envelope stress response membrane protein PspC [unclassified Arsenophonus]PAV04191.1 envelope stress response membrane protein PspC [Arsenophonus sp. ENCA]QLK88425.1 envelope stress response membrane protein PspC [Arsenophonus endosymbiont of Aphis craccivora]